MERNRRGDEKTRRGKERGEKERKIGKVGEEKRGDKKEMERSMNNKIEL